MEYMENRKDPELDVSEALHQAAAVFKAYSETARLDASVLLGHIMKRSRAWIIAHPETPLAAKDRVGFTRSLEDAAAGIPLPYIIGHQEFYGLDFFVNRDVLIPRPETELVVELALNWFAAHPDRRVAADIGTGSGCIAVSLAKNLPHLTVYAGDISEAALRVAKKNIMHHRVGSRVHLACGDLTSALTHPIDVMCANLPYIPSSVLEGLAISRYEPHRALDGGGDGLLYIHRLLEQAPAWVNPGGFLLLEIQIGQGPVVSELAREMFGAATVKCHPDVAGVDRVVSIELMAVTDTILGDNK